MMVFLSGFIVGIVVTVIAFVIWMLSDLHIQ